MMIFLCVSLQSTATKYTEVVILVVLIILIKYLETMKKIFVVIRILIYLLWLLKFLLNRMVLPERKPIVYVQGRLNLLVIR